MMPTEIQKSHPHSIVVDFLPWPGLRDHFCVSGDADPRHSIHFYNESVKLRCPPIYSLFALDDMGRVSLSAEFETIIYDLKNWTIGPPWSHAFPHLTHLVVQE